MIKVHLMCMDEHIACAVRDRFRCCCCCRDGQVKFDVDNAKLFENLPSALKAVIAHLDELFQYNCIDEHYKNYWSDASSIASVAATINPSELAEFSNKIANRQLQVDRTHMLMIECADSISDMNSRLLDVKANMSELQTHLEHTEFAAEAYMSEVDLLSGDFEEMQNTKTDCLSELQSS